MGIRQAGEPLPKFWVVYPDGSITNWFYARNLAPTGLEVSDGRRRALNPATGRIELVPLDDPDEPDQVVGRLRVEYSDYGYQDLERAFKADPRPYVRTKGWLQWLRYNYAADTGRLKRVPSPERNLAADGKTVLMVLEPFPKELLPLSVIAAREKTAPHSRKSWSPPEIPVEGMEPDAEPEMNETFQEQAAAELAAGAQEAAAELAAAQEKQPIEPHEGMTDGG